MSTATALPLMSVEEFFELPEPTGDFTYELHFGELIKVGRAKKRHGDLQEVIREILVRVLGTRLWMIGTEMPYGLTPGYDARAAGVGVMRRKTWNSAPDDGFPIGSPELVVQVKSRSNRDRKMEEDAIVHITHGATAVLLVKPERWEIVMATASSGTTYRQRDRIQLPPPFSKSIAVDEIFPRR